MLGELCRRNVAAPGRWFLAVLVFATSQPGESKAQSITNYVQISFTGEVNIPDSEWGSLDLTFTGSSGLQYFNLNIDGNWTLQSFPVVSPRGAGVIQTVSLQFSLGVARGTDISGTTQNVNFTLGSSLGADPGMGTALTVGSRTDTAEGGLLPGTAQVFAAPPTLVGSTSTDSDTTAIHGDFPNQEQLADECVPAAVSNSLMFLKQRNPNSAWGSLPLDIATMKTATNWGFKASVNKTGSWALPDPSRPAGERTAWWQDKAEYMAEHNYPVMTTQVTSMQEVFDAVKAGKDVEISGGWHAAAVMAVHKRGGGQTWILGVAHDRSQGPAGGLVQEVFLYDPAQNKFRGGSPGFFEGSVFRYGVVEMALPNEGGKTGPQLESRGFDDGHGERLWRDSNPAGPDDWFSVDFDNSLSSCLVVCLQAALHSSVSNSSPSFSRLGLYSDNLTLDPSGATPDVSGAGTIVELTGTSSGRGHCELQSFDVPLIHLGPDSNVHVALRMNPGDSATWICADTSAPAGRSFASQDAYQTPALNMDLNWMLRAAVVPTSATSGSLLVNGDTAATVEQLQTAAFTFYGPAEGVLSAMFTAPPLPVSKVSPLIATGFGGPIPTAWTLSGMIDCLAPLGFPLPFNVFYLDPTDSLIKKSSTAALTVLPSPHGCGTCFGQRDDGRTEGTLFRVNQPAGSLDWFNVRHGAPTLSSGVASLTGVELATWDLCGTSGATFAEVGIYPANLALSPAGDVPDLSSPLASVFGPAVSSGRVDWGYPAAFFDTPDVTASTSVIHHAAVQWAAGDSCLWIAADTNSTGPDPCGMLPNSSSFASPNAYLTSPTAAPASNWMMKIDWQ